MTTYSAADHFLKLAADLGAGVSPEKLLVSTDRPVHGDRVIKRDTPQRSSATQSNAVKEHTMEQSFLRIEGTAADSESKKPSTQRELEQSASSKFMAMAKSLGMTDHEQPVPQGAPQNPRYQHHHAFTRSQAHQKQSEAQFVADFMANKIANEAIGIESGAVHNAAVVTNAHAPDMWVLNSDSSPVKKVQGSNVPAASVDCLVSPPRYLSVPEMALGLAEQGKGSNRRVNASIRRQTSTKNSVKRASICNHDEKLNSLSTEFLQQHAQSHPALAAKLKAIQAAREETNRNQERRAQLFHRRRRNRVDGDVSNQIEPESIHDDKACIGDVDKDVTPETSSSDLVPVDSSPDAEASQGAIVASPKPVQKKTKIVVVVDASVSIVVDISLQAPTRSLYNVLHSLNDTFFSTAATPVSNCRSNRLLYSGLGSLQSISAPIYRDMTPLSQFCLSSSTFLQFVDYFASVSDAAAALNGNNRRRPQSLQESKEAQQQHGDRDTSRQWYSTGIFFGANSFGTSPSKILKSSVSLVGALLHNR